MSRCGIDTNAYTNVMAAWLSPARGMPWSCRRRDQLTLLEALDIGAGDLATWDEVSRRIFVPFRERVIGQFEGYEHLAELVWDGYRGWYGNIHTWTASSKPRMTT
jgi:alpha,alpha-trehalase